MSHNFFYILFNNILYFTAQLAYEATNPTKASNNTDSSLVGHESDYKPRPFNINITRDTNMKAEDCKDPLMVNSHSPKASEEQGDSIAKVLEWFSRSSDSSDKHDCEDIIQDIEDDIKIEDLDFEDEINSRPKPENNVYVIIPRHRDEDSGMVNEGDFAIKMNVNKKEPPIHSQGVQELIGQTKPLSVKTLSAMESSTPFSHGSPQDTTNRQLDPEKTSPKEIMLETASKKEESRNADKTEIPESKPIQHELGESQSPKIVNLSSVWDSGTTEAPMILEGKANINSEKENLDQNNFVSKVIEYKKEPAKVDISPKYSVLENKKQSHVNDVSNVDGIQSDDNMYEYLNKKETSFRDKAKDMKQPMTTNDNINQMEDIMALSATSDEDFSKRLDQKSYSSLDFGLQIGDQNNENENAAIPELDPNVDTEEEESQRELPPTSSVNSEQQNPVSLAKQSKQQQENKAERIKELRSFWERERLQPKVYLTSMAANDTNSSVTSTKLNKRFTKSAYDLRSIGTEPEAETVKFTVIPLRDRIEKTAVGEGMNSLQFKMLRDFWAGSSKKSSNFENKIQNPSQEVKHAKIHKEVNQQEQVDAKHSLIQKVCPNQSDEGFGNYSGNAMSPKTDRGLQSSLKEKTVVRHSDTGTTANSNFSPTEPNVSRSSHCPQPKSGSQLSPKDMASTYPTGVLNKESHQQTKSSGKGTLNGRGNSLRRATSMFAINMEDQDQDFPLQSEKVSDTVLPQLLKTTESTVLPSAKMAEANLQVKTSPEITRSKHKATEISTSEDSDSQPLARSFVPRDYQHYLGITENSGKYISPQDTEQKSELVCTPFQTGSSASCCVEEADTSLDSARLCTRRGSFGLRSSTPAGEDVNPENLNRVDSFSGSSANCETYIFFLFPKFY